MLEDNVEMYRAMTPGERLALALRLSRRAWDWMDVPDRETGRRKWAAWNRQHELGNQSLLAELRRLRDESRHGS